MDRKDFYNANQTDEFKILELWKATNSPVVHFVEKIQNEFGIVINYISGHIVKYEEEESPHFKEVLLRFVLNNEIVDAERIYYDDKQFFVRIVGEQRIRRISMKVIKEVQYEGRFLKFGA